jgi:hypothetical protein
MPVDLSMSLYPNSFKSTTKVAMQGKNIESTTQATINCFDVNASGASIPTATSFLKKPVKIATIDSFGSPSKPVITGAVKLAT